LTIVHDTRPRIVSPLVPASASSSFKGYNGRLKEPLNAALKTFPADRGRKTDKPGGDAKFAGKK
jgi:hypothetical protein